MNSQPGTPSQLDASRPKPPEVTAQPRPEKRPSKSKETRGLDLSMPLL
ncbi:MAG: hypothetical protein RBU37_23545 [Myxococcota bacterium]|jgi:hypothetical protein|nr:hypothetical protein [Myxococcota bacterium]